MKKEVKIVLIASIIVIAIALAYILIFYTPECANEECFAEHLVNCQKASYIRNGEETINYYKILGKEDNQCLVKVKMLQIKKGNIELSVLEGKEMVCSLPLGVLASPEQNLKNCQGLLKETIQEIVIDRMHSQLLENIGEIGEVSKVL